jgi:predicted dehydrogenase
MMTRKINSISSVAVFGAGRMGRRHVHSIRKLGLKLMGIVDPSPGALQEAKAEHALTDNQVFVCAEDLYAISIPECLVVSTTADSHCSLVCAAAERGVKYILVEKPMAVSLTECERMIATCLQFGARLAVNHQMRFMQQYSAPKELLNSEAYGGVKSMTVVGGNFGMAMNGTHYFEAFRFLCDENPVEVTAWFSPEIVPNPRGAQFEDRAGAVRVVTESGKRLYLEIGADQGHGVQVTYAARNGIISINELTGQMTTSVREAQYRELPTTRYGMPAELDQLTIAPTEVIDSTAQVLRALLSDDSESVTAQQGMLAIKVLVAAYTSAENGGATIKLDGNIDASRVFPWA